MFKYIMEFLVVIVILLAFCGLIVVPFCERRK